MVLNLLQGLQGTNEPCKAPETKLSYMYVLNSSLLSHNYNNYYYASLVEQPGFADL